MLQYQILSPGSSGVNAFSQDWSHHNNQLCPPVYLTCKVVSAQETLILPVWKSAHFWPLLCSDGVHWSKFIHGWVILPNFPNTFIACKATNSILVVSLYLRIDFSIPSRVRSESLDVGFIVPWQFCATSANFCRSWFLFSFNIYPSKFILRVKSRSFVDFIPLRRSSCYPCWIRTLVPGGIFVFCTLRFSLFVTVLMTPRMGSLFTPLVGLFLCPQWAELKIWKSSW